MPAWGALLSALALVIACAPGDRSSSDAARSGEQSAAPGAPVGAEGSASDSLDRWTKGEVVKRLAEAGLVVVDSGVAPPYPPLSRSGERVYVSGSELRLYVFDDAASRAAASAALDTVPPATGYATEWERRPRVILVNNLMALHFTPNERLAERVDNVLRARHLGSR